MISHTCHQNETVELDDLVVTCFYGDVTQEAVALHLVEATHDLGRPRGRNVDLDVAMEPTKYKWLMRRYSACYEIKISFTLRGRDTVLDVA